VDGTVSALTIKVPSFAQVKKRHLKSLLPGIIDAKNTTETVDDDGWVHTGDVAEIDQCGRVKIIDRVKVCSQFWLRIILPSSRNLHLIL